MDKQKYDIASTIAGGGAGLALLVTVQWNTVPHGELIKIGVSLFLVVIGYFAYSRNCDGPGPTKPA